MYNPNNYTDDQIVGVEDTNVSHMLDMYAKAHGSSSAYQNDSDNTNVSIWDGLNNLFTGNLDYKRSLESAMRAEERSAYEAEKARKFSSAEAQKQRDWQEMMSNTAYSRAIADLKKNGINPYAVGAFGAASTPSGGTATAYAGNGYTGNNYNSGKDGWGILSSLIQTAYKENAAMRRKMLDMLPDLMNSLLASSQSPIGFI